MTLEISRKIKGINLFDFIFGEIFEGSDNFVSLRNEHSEHMHLFEMPHLAIEFVFDFFEEG